MFATTSFTALLPALASSTNGLLFSLNTLDANPQTLYPIIDMFVDKARVKVQAGNGGNGIVSFRHEKFVDKGGPDGGDGGDGGDVIFQASRNQNTLAAFRYKKDLKASGGENGSKRKRRGKSGQDLIVQVPVGTVALTADGESIADLAQDGQQAVIAQGGKGGFGNAHFVSSRRQVPRVAEKGEPGDEHTLTLELKMIADVGLVGLPNAGKSTLLASISSAKPEIADYPFTTLTPNLGVVDVDDKTSLLFADIPGLIEGASRGKGLGDEFLRHIERTSVLVHVVDIYQDDIVQAYRTIQGELKDYKIDLSNRPQIVAINKTDGVDSKAVATKLAQLQKVAPPLTPLFTISAASGQGVAKLLFEVKDQVKKEQTRAKRRAKKSMVPILRFTGKDDSWQAVRDGQRFLVTGHKIERFAGRTDFENIAGVERLRDIMRKMGIMAELERQGIEPGQVVIIGNKHQYKIEY